MTHIIPVARMNSRGTTKASAAAGSCSAESAPRSSARSCDLARVGMAPPRVPHVPICTASAAVEAVSGVNMKRCGLGSVRCEDAKMWVREGSGRSNVWAKVQRSGERESGGLIALTGTER
eukprot:1160058-Pelagomonas_calceolata.AAC.16